MTKLEIILSAMLSLSLLLNVGLIIYVRTAIIQLLSVSDELSDLRDMINSFADHLDTVYQLEMFYGDESIKALLEHAYSFNEQLTTFEYIYSLTEEEGTEIVNDNEETDAEEA